MEQSENKHEEIPGMNLSINATETCRDILASMTEDKIRHTIQVDHHVGALAAYVIHA